MVRVKEFLKENFDKECSYNKTIVQVGNSIFKVSCVSVINWKDGKLCPISVVKSRRGYQVSIGAIREEEQSGFLRSQREAIEYIKRNV